MSTTWCIPGKMTRGQSPGIECVLFDLDGTFADTAPDLHYALDQVLVSRGELPMPFEQVRPAVSHGSQAMIKVGFDLQPGDTDYETLRIEFLRIYRENIARKTKLFDGMERLLEELELRNIPWGIVTNKPAWLTDPLMEALGYHRRAACIVSGDTADHPKPHPAPMLYACRMAGVDPTHCLYVGDAKRDIEAGQNAGTQTLVALFGYLAEEDKPDDWHASGAVKHPLEILQWLD